MNEGWSPKIGILETPLERFAMTRAKNGDLLRSNVLVRACRTPHKVDKASRQMNMFEKYKKRQQGNYTAL